LFDCNLKEESEEGGNDLVVATNNLKMYSPLSGFEVHANS
jgi:hypothetical protein